MTVNMMRKFGHLIVCIGICCGFILTAPLAAAAESVPESYKIDGVPLYQQIDARGCGAASLQMVFDYYGPFIDQMEIYNAARSGGTTLPDMARAAQFSWMSTTAGNRFPNSAVTGYTGRAIGYAGFYYAATEPWLDQLKYIVSQGYPVIVLVWWAPGYAGGDHYRVIVGYDDVEGVLIVNDPWSREYKTDSEYYGSTSQSANSNGQDTSFAGVKWKYEDFLWTWQCPTTRWGVPDLAYGGVFVAPWQVVISAPEMVSAGARFKVEATVTYPCVAPFGSTEFPVFTARAFDAVLNPGDGFAVVKSPELSRIGSLGAGQSVDLSWTLVAGKVQGTYSFDVAATGLVSGSLGPWHDYPEYDYEDAIGGMASFEVSISQ
ncbi:MAG: C39 family peptidase [Thermoplasmata archaeon]